MISPQLDIVKVIVDWMREELIKLDVPAAAGIDRINQDTIVTRNFVFDDDPNDDFMRALRPGVIIAPAADGKVGGRLNGCDDVTYPISVQFFDRDMSTNIDEERAAYWRLLKRMTRALFNETDARDEIPGIMWMTVPSESWVQKVRFQRHRLAVWAVPVLVTIREERLAQSRSLGINGVE